MDLFLEPLKLIGFDVLAATEDEGIVKEDT